MSDPLAILSAHELMARAMEVAPEAYQAFARAIANADPGLGGDFAWAVSHPEASDSLGAAWDEAEAALPEGADLAVSKTVGVQSGTHVAVSADAGVHAYADTPSAALRALAAKCREVGQ